MKIKNNTNGKIVDILKKNFQSFTEKQKSNFTVIEENDKQDIVQVVENSIEKKKIKDKKSEEIIDSE